MGVGHKGIVGGANEVRLENLLLFRQVQYLCLRQGFLVRGWGGWGGGGGTDIGLMVDV